VTGSRVLVIGGGICGLGTALLLARDGHDVTVLERDSSPLPASPHDAWEGWNRPGVAQFRQPHNFMPGLRLLLEAELPDIQDALSRSGAARFDLLHPLPRSLTDQSPRPIDDRLWTLTARRPVGEWVFADAARREPRVTIRSGARARDLIAGPPVVAGIPHVAGVRLTDGEELHADLVVDATGRLSRAPDWLATIGSRRPIEEQADSGFVYYTRYFRGAQPARVGPVLGPLGTISVLTLPGDNDSWSVTLFTSTGDQPLKTLRHEEVWTRVVRACPLYAHWLEGEPVSSVLAMAGIVDRCRRFAVDGEPVVTGFVAVADAWACTNPSAGRGLTVGFLQALQLRDTLRRRTGDPLAIVEEFDARTEVEIKPWYDAQVALDRYRFAEMNALREGRDVPRPADELAIGVRALLSAMVLDPELYRAAIEYIATLTPIQRILQRPEVQQRLTAVRASLPRTSPPSSIPGPTRAQLLELAG
jgi:2-polyprenyl-6-methoxyphenol hydroxylase-like FAD-dependent oxidoreductase